MDKPNPNTSRLWQCVRYYLKLCLARGQSPDTIRGKKAGLKKFVKWCRGHNIYRIEQVDLDLTDNYMEYLNCYRKPLDGNPLSRAQKRNLLTFVKTFIEKIHAKGLIKENTLEHIELPKKGRTLPKAIFKLSEIEVILAQPLQFGIEGICHRAILETFFASGIRRTELSMLDVENVDLTDKLLRVNHGKGHKERIVPISERACQWLTLYLGRIRPLVSFVGSGSALFLANNGKRFRPNQLSEMASRYVKLAGLKRGGSCYLFRHATATEMLNNGAGICDVQDMLGHSDISTTRIYAQVSRVKLIEVYKKSHPSALSNKSLFVEGVCDEPPT